MNRRLFVLRNSAGKRWGAQVYRYKQAAKAVRDELNANGGDYHVSRGPDHIGPHGTPGRKPWRKY